MKLAYRDGFRESSLADIAKAAHVPVGNVYYYFKTKEELGEAVVERRLEEIRAFKAEMDRLSSPKERLFAFVDNIQRNKEQFARAGCPFGGLCAELQKEGALSRKNPRSSTPSPWAGLRSSSGPPATKRIHENLRYISSAPFRVWPQWRTALTTPM